MKNVNELRSQLCDVFSKLRANKIKPETARELSSTAGKIIGSVKLELEYAAQRKVKPVIPFLNVSGK